MDGSWKVGQAQDVTSTGGCFGLGIQVPSVTNDLLKMDLDHLGNPQLYFGSAVNPMESHVEIIKPTSYLPPLQHCRNSRSHDINNRISNDLPLLPDARIAHSKSATTPLSWTVVMSTNLAVAILWQKLATDSVSSGFFIS